MVGWVPAILKGASILGGLMGTSQKKQQGIDPEWLKKHFGAGAVTDEMVQLFNNIIRSPYGQQQMQGAAEQGSQFQNDLARGAAGAGFGPAGGAESGASVFSQAAAGGATNSLQRGVKSDIYQSVIPAAQQMVQDRMKMAVAGELQRLQGANAQPTMMNQLGGLITRGADAALASQGVNTADTKSGGGKSESQVVNAGSMGSGGYGIGGAGGGGFGQGLPSNQSFGPTNPLNRTNQTMNMLGSNRSSRYKPGTRLVLSGGS